MVELAQLRAGLGLDEAAVARVLAARTEDPRPRQPAYVQVLLGIGAWITAILMVAFVLLFLDLAVGVDLEEQAPVAVAIGAASFAIAVALRRAADAGAFRIQLATALSVAGVGLAAAAVLVFTESFWPAAVVAALGAAAAVAEGRDRATQFLSTALTVGLVFAALGIDRGPYLTDLAALCGVAGVALTLRPPRRDLAPLAAVLLLTLPCLMMVADAGVLAGAEGEGVPARLVNAVLAIWLLNRHRVLSGRATVDATTIVLGPVVLAVCVLLPPGGSAALVLMMLAFVYGLRWQGVIGVLFQIYFIWRFYYDLQITLLDKSLILTGVGLLLLGAYAFALHRRKSVR